MQHLETCLLIAEADSVLCHLVMFLTVETYGQNLAKSQKVNELIDCLHFVYKMFFPMKEY